MLIKKLLKSGGGLVVGIPRPVLRLLNWTDDQMLELTITADGKGIMVRKVETEGRELTQDEIAALTSAPPSWES